MPETLRKRVIKEHRAKSWAKAYAKNVALRAEHGEASYKCKDW